MISHALGQNEMICIHRNDISLDVLDYATNQGIVSCDIETTGLDFRVDKPVFCQLYLPEGQAHIIVLGDKRPDNLGELLANGRTEKIFHQALFDLTFLSYHYNITGVNVKCTKIASKLCGPANSHSLKKLLSDYLGIEIDKELQSADWTKQPLTKKHLAYMVNDVRHLLELYKVLYSKLVQSGNTLIAERCFEFLPVRVELARQGIDDVFAY